MGRAILACCQAQAQKTLVCGKRPGSGPAGLSTVYGRVVRKESLVEAVIVRIETHDQQDIWRNLPYGYPLCLSAARELGQGAVCKVLDESQDVLRSVPTSKVIVSE